MIFDLLHAPFPEGYGEDILSLEACKVHLRVDGDDEDDLIKALRDAAIDFVERYCAVKLQPTEGLVWVASGFPLHGPTQRLPLDIRPVTAVTAISWRRLTGENVEGQPTMVMVTRSGDVLPAIGTDWPSMVAGDVSVEFTAGFDEPPPSLLSAVRLFLGHLYKNREAVTDRGTEGEVPFGVRQICAPFRRITI